jgi:hypothetical protein
MLNGIQNPHQRRITARTMLDLFRLWSATFLDSDRFGVKSGDLLILAAVLVGQLEGRPMNASKLSDYSGIPRPTVVRMLRTMGRRGMIERVDKNGFIASPSMMNTPQAIACAGKARALIVEMGGELSKLDSDAIAPR